MFQRTETIWVRDGWKEGKRLFSLRLLNFRVVKQQAVGSVECQVLNTETSKTQIYSQKSSGCRQKETGVLLRLFRTRP